LKDWTLMNFSDSSIRVFMLITHINIFYVSWN